MRLLEILELLIVVAILSVGAKAFAQDIETSQECAQEYEKAVQKHIQMESQLEAKVREVEELGLELPATVRHNNELHINEARKGLSAQKDLLATWKMRCKKLARNEKFDALLASNEAGNEAQKALKEAEAKAFEAARKKEVSIMCSIIEVKVKKCSWWNVTCNDDIQLRSWIDGAHYNTRDTLLKETDTHKVTTAYLCTSIKESKHYVSFVDIMETDPFGAWSTWIRLVIDGNGNVMNRDADGIPKRIQVTIRKAMKELEDVMSLEVIEMLSHK